MKLRFILIVAVIFLLVPYEWAAAADLSSVRTGKHETFARVVFKFQNTVQFKSPTINGKGKFSLVFLDSATKLPRLTLYKTGKTQMVQSIEYVRQKSNLTAIVRLTFPYFILKSYALSAPYRIVVDAYWMTSPTENNEQKESLPRESVTEPSPLPDKKEIPNILQKTTEKTVSEPSMTPLTAKKPLLKESKTSQNASSDNKSNPLPDKKETPNILQKTTEKTASEPSMTPLTAKKPLLKESKTSQNASSDNKSNQMPEEKKTTPSPSKGNNNTQIYLLAILDVIAGCIVLLLFFTLFKKKQTINIGRLCDVLDNINTSDQRITEIDDQIQSAFKKYDQS